jgi:cell division protease FtsH
MVTIYGMNKRIGNISFYDPQQSEYGFTKPYSESTAQAIDEEVKKIVDIAYERTKKLLIEKRPELELIAQELLKKEVIFQQDIERMIGKRPYEKPMPIEEPAPTPMLDPLNEPKVEGNTVS